MTFNYKLLQSNGEDLKDPVEKLETQQRFIESAIGKLSRPELSKSGHVQDLVEPLWRYLLFVYILVETHLLRRRQGIKEYTRQTNHFEGQI